MLRTGYFVRSIIQPSMWRHDIQHNDTQHNDTQCNDTQHNDIQHKDPQLKGLICDTQHNDIQHNITLSVIILIVAFYLLLC